VVPEAIMCACITGSCITGYDVTEMTSLNDLSLVADYTGIVSKIQMMLCMIIYSLSISHGLLHA
jgi:hypothetical protein